MPVLIDEKKSNLYQFWRFVKKLFVKCGRSASKEQRSQICFMSERNVANLPEKHFQQLSCYPQKSFSESFWHKTFRGTCMKLSNTLTDLDLNESLLTAATYMTINNHPPVANLLVKGSVFYAKNYKGKIHWCNLDVILSVFSMIGPGS